MNHRPNLTIQDTSRVLDITGLENTLILLAAPGDEVTACGGLIAEACARGRPPFVAILGDGAPDGCARLAHQHERASRIACRLLGLPDDRLLFVGLRQCNFPTIETPLFKALQAAMAEVSWRRDCNIILAPFATQRRGDAADAAMAWELACALASEIGATLLAGFTTTALPYFDAVNVSRLNAPQWAERKTEAALAHGTHIRDAGYEIYGRLA
jgi:LmbE family N-acetylglucosaminyl deacetylase